MTASAAVRRLARLSRVAVALTGPGASAEFTRARLVLLLDGGPTDGALEDELAALEPERNATVGAATARGGHTWASPVADGDGPRDGATRQRDGRVRPGAPFGAQERGDRRELAAAVGRAGATRANSTGSGAAGAEAGRDGGGAPGPSLGTAGAVTRRDDRFAAAALAAERRPDPVPVERRRSLTSAGDGRAGGGHDDRGPAAAGFDAGSAARHRFGADSGHTRVARGDHATDDHGRALPLSRLAALGAATPVARDATIVVAAESRSASMRRPADPPRPQAARAREPRPPAVVETAPTRSRTTAKPAQALVATTSPAGSGLQDLVAWWEGRAEHGRPAPSVAPDDRLTGQKQSFRSALEDVLVSEAHASGIEVRP